MHSDTLALSQGMNGCGNYGVLVLDTTGGRVRVWYFDIMSTDTGIDRYAEASSLVFY